MLRVGKGWRGDNKLGSFRAVSLRIIYIWVIKNKAIIKRERERDVQRIKKRGIERVD